MRPLRWNTSHVVFVTEIDDEHREIFQGVCELREAIAGPASAKEVRKLTKELVRSITRHFAHEERLMRTAQYGSTEWHKRQHINARKRVAQLAAVIERGETGSAHGLVEYLTRWLRDHTRIADRMLGAFLRNQRA
jgi:hemerythrin-like metal-binding protein